RSHVRWELKQCGQPFRIDKSQSLGKGGWGRIAVGAGDDESPLAERGNIDVIGISPESSVLDCLRNAPIGVACEHRRRALYDHQSLYAEMSGCGLVERGRVELAERVVRGIGKVDDNEIEAVGIRVYPREGVGIDDMNLVRQKGLLVQGRQHRVGGEQPSHLRIEIDKGDGLHLRILQNFSDGKAVASA